MTQIYFSAGTLQLIGVVLLLGAILLIRKILNPKIDDMIARETAEAIARDTHDTSCTSCKHSSCHDCTIDELVSKFGKEERQNG